MNDPHTTTCANVVAARRAMDLHLPTDDAERPNGARPQEASESSTRRVQHQLISESSHSEPCQIGRFPANTASPEDTTRGTGGFADRGPSDVGRFCATRT